MRAKSLSIKSFGVRVIPLCAIATLALIGACKKSTPAAPIIASSMAAVGSTADTLHASTTASSLQVKVTASDGTPVSGVTVAWAVMSGVGAVASNTSVTGTDGVATAAYTPGTTTGSASVFAGVPGLSGTTFTVTVIP